MSSRLAGHSCTASAAVKTFRRSSSEIVLAASAILPILARALAASLDLTMFQVSIATQRSRIRSETSPSGGASCVA